MTGTLTNDLVSPALIGGLVLIVMLIGFTVMQNAFAGGGLGAWRDQRFRTQSAGADRQRRHHLRLGCGRPTASMSAPRSRPQLGLDRGALEGPASDWLDLLHPFERDRYRASLDTMLEQRRGRINQEFRLRAADGHYFWFLLKARPVVGADGEVIRVIGTLADVTEQKTAKKRLLHDAVHDNLTGLPNRELFFDRLDAALKLSQTDAQIRPTVICIDIDRFKQVNETHRPFGRQFDPADHRAARSAAS